MSLETILAIVIPVVLIIVVIVLLLKFVPELFDSFCGRDEEQKTREYIDLEVGSGVLLSPEPYHMTWPAPEAEAYSPFNETPKTATPQGIQVIEKPPRSPRVMTSLVSPIKTGCSPPKRIIRGEEQLPHSPVVIPNFVSRVKANTRPFGRFV